MVMSLKTTTSSRLAYAELVKIAWALGVSSSTRKTGVVVESAKTDLQISTRMKRMVVKLAIASFMARKGAKIMRAMILRR